jgi:hypothetical protein
MQYVWYKNKVHATKPSKLVSWLNAPDYVFMCKIKSSVKWYIMHNFWKNLDSSGQRPVVDPYEHGNEPLGSIKSGEFDQLSDYSLPQKGSVPWS